MTRTDSSVHQTCSWWVVAGLALAVVMPRMAGASTGADAERDLVVERFGQERGLPVDNVTAILQDRAGFIWIGTRAGLVMYDGESATTFEHDISNPRSIADNYVRTVYEDREGNLWIGTNSSGLDRLDRASWTFEHFRHDSAHPTTISHDSVNVILEDREGRIWVGTQIGLNRFDPASGVFHQILADPDDPGGLSHDYVYALCEDHDGVLWVGTVGGGLDRMDPETGSFTHFRHDPGNAASLRSDKVFAVVEDAGGRIWVGTEEGLDSLDRTRSAFSHYPSAPGTPGGLSYPLVTSLVIDPQQVLWVGTWGGGVDRIDPGKGTLLASPARSAPELAEDRVAALAGDHAGAVWIGTWARGVFRSRPPAIEAGLLTTAQGLSFNDVTAVFEDNGGRLWVGTWGQGLNLRREGDSRFDAEFRGRLGALASGTILSLREDRSDGVWVGTMGSLFHVERDGRSTPFAHDPNDPSSLGHGYVTALLRDSSGVLWVGVGGSGLYRLRQDGAGFDAFLHDPEDPGTLSDDYITALVEDREGFLWVGTRSGGVNVLDRGTGRCVRYVPDPEDENSLSYHYVTSLAVDDSGTVWIATAGGGLNAARRSGGKVHFEHFTEQQGLVDDTIRAMVADGRVLWLGTPHGLTRFDSTSKTFRSFDVSDGLPTGGFNGGAACAGRKQLFFGSSNGLLVIPKGLVTPPSPKSPTVLRTVRTLAGRVSAETPPWNLARLEVPYGEILTFGFAVLDYGDRRRHRFAYRVTGLRDDWIEIGNRREVTFTDLDPGKYVLEVRGRDSHGAWNPATSSLELVVVPPFWMTIWFRLIVAGLLVLAVFGAHRRRTSTLERRNRELEALKNQREAALAEMHASREQLHEAYGRLRRLTRRLELAKEEERKRIARELHDEMGQGLTAAKINLQLLGSMLESEEAADRAVDTIGLVDRMIQHVRTLSLDLRPPLLDELGLGPALRSYLEAQARRAGLEIEISTAELPPELPSEVEITAFRCVQEALTNVMRHAEASHVAVRVSVVGEGLEISVRDDGRGFDVGQALQRAAGGQHLGLLGIRERVESLGGRLDIESSPGTGTSIAVHIPWR